MVMRMDLRVAKFKLLSYPNLKKKRKFYEGKVKVWLEENFRWKKKVFFYCLSAGFILLVMLFLIWGIFKSSIYAKLNEIGIHSTKLKGKFVIKFEGKVVPTLRFGSYVSGDFNLISSKYSLYVDGEILYVYYNTFGLVNGVATIKVKSDSFPVTVFLYPEGRALLGKGKFVLKVDGLRVKVECLEGTGLLTFGKNKYRLVNGAKLNFYNGKLI